MYSYSSHFNSFSRSCSICSIGSGFLCLFLSDFSCCYSFFQDSFGSSSKERLKRTKAAKEATTTTQATHEQDTAPTEEATEARQARKATTTKDAATEVTIATDAAQDQATQATEAIPATEATAQDTEAPTQATEDTAPTTEAPTQATPTRQANTFFRRSLGDAQRHATEETGALLLWIVNPKKRQLLYLTCEQYHNRAIT